MAKKINIAELSIDTKAFISKAEDLNRKIEALKKKQSELRREGESSTNAFNKNAIELKKLSSEYTETKNVLVNLIDTTGDYVNLQDQLNKTLNTSEKSIQGVRNQNKELLKIRNQLDLSTQSGKDSLDAINEKLDDNNKFIKENVSAYEQQKINIGNYKSALEGVSPVLGNITTILSGIKQGLTDYGIAMKSSGVATKGTSKSLNVFKIALLGTGIGVLLIALGSLITFLSTTQKGIDKVSSVLTPLKAVFSAFVGVVQEVGGALFDAFSKPQETVKKLWEAIKTNVVNRVSGLIDTFKAVGKVIQSAFTLDFASFKEGIKEVGESIAQTVTGVDDLPNKLAKGFNKLKDGINEAVETGKRIAELQIEIEESEIRLVQSRAESNKIIKEQNKIAEDTTRTLAEREEASRKAIEQSEYLLEIEQGILDKKIEQKELQNSLNDTSREDELALAELKAERDEKETGVLELQTTLTNKLNTIRTQQIATENKAIDEQLKKQQTLLNIFIASEGAKAKSFEDQLKFANDVNDKRIALFDEQLAKGKLTEEEYALAVLNSRNELAGQISELTLGQAERELEIFKNAYQQRIDDNTFFSEQILQSEVERLDKIAEKEQEYHLKRLEQGVINQQEYNDAINKVDEENRIAKQEAEKLREEAIKEQAIIDLENQRIIDEENFLTQFEIESSRLEQQRQQELANVESTNASVELINKKYDLRQEKLDKATSDQRIAIAGETFGKIAGFLGETTALGKLSALAQASINIQQGITKALATKGFAGIVEGALIASAGAISIGKIVSTPTSFYEGGKVPELGSGIIDAPQNIPTQKGGDNILAMVKRGEVILNEEQQKRAGGSAFFRSIGVPSFATGGLIGTVKEASQSLQKDGFNVKEFAEVVANTINEMKIVAIENDITNAQGLQTEIIEGARI